MRIAISVNAIVRDVSAASAAIGALVTNGLLTGSAQTWATGILAAVSAMILVFSQGSVKSVTPDPVNNTPGQTDATSTNY